MEDTTQLSGIEVLKYAFDAVVIQKYLKKHNIISEADEYSRIILSSKEALLYYAEEARKLEPGISLIVFSEIEEKIAEEAANNYDF